jgi:transcriptional antiterminator NusG
VIHTYSGYENKVKANIEHRVETMGMKDKIFQIIVPMEDELEYKDGKQRLVQKKVFPGYVLVEMIITDESWYLVRNTPGVTGFVGFGNKPSPLDPKEIHSILQRMGMEEPRARMEYEIGTRVKVVRGPFQNFEGEVEEVNPERGKLKITISMFGRDTPIELDYGQVEKID